MGACRNAVAHIECTTSNCNIAEHSIDHPRSSEGGEPQGPAGATLSCGNQRIQLGKTQPTSVRLSDRGVWQLQADATSAVGDFMGEYLGLVTTASSFSLPIDGSINALPFTNSRLGKSDTAVRDCATVITTAKMGNNTRFIVHDCVPNCKTELWWTNGYPHLMVVARGIIREGTILTLDFRVADNPIFNKANLRGNGTGSPCSCVSCSEGHDGRGALVAYTDGSGKNGRWGVVVVVRPPLFPGAVADKNSGEKLTELFGPVVTTPLTPATHSAHPFFMGASEKTNNTAELTGLGEAMLWFKHFSDREAITIYSDSQISVDLITGKTDPQDNKPLVYFVRSLYADMNRRISLVHVKAHSDHLWNNHADELCRRVGCCTVGRYGHDRPTREGFPTAAPAPERRSINRVKFDSALRAHPSASASQQRKSPSKTPLTDAAQRMGGAGKLSTTTASTEAHPFSSPCTPPVSNNLAYHHTLPLTHPSTVDILAGIGRAGLANAGQNFGGAVIDDALSLGFFSFESFPGKGLTTTTAPSIRQRTLWHMIIASIRQTIAPPANALAAFIRGSAVPLLTVGIRAHGNSLTEIIQGYFNVAPDGLCGFRTAYRAYLRSIGRPDADPDLRDKFQREAFMEWLGGRLEHFQVRKPNIATKIQAVLAWVPSADGYGGSVASPSFPKEHWFGFPDFAEVDAPFDGYTGNDSDGALFCGPTVPIIVVQLVDPDPGCMAAMYKRSAPAEVRSVFALAYPATYDHLCAGLGPSKTLSFFDGSHFWLFERPDLGITQLDAALNLLCDATIKRTLEHLPQLGSTDMTGDSPPRSRNAKPRTTAPATKKKTLTKSPPPNPSVIDLAEDSDSETPRPTLQCPSCGPRTGWTCTDSQTRAMPCAQCSAQGAPTGITRLHCLDCNEYFCPTCAKPPTAEVKTHNHPPQQTSSPTPSATARRATTATPTLSTLRHCPYCTTLGDTTFGAAAEAWQCQFHINTCGNTGGSGTPRLFCSSCNRSTCSSCSIVNPALRREALEADSARHPQPPPAPCRPIRSCTKCKGISYDSPNWSCRDPACSPRKSTRPTDSTSEPNNDIKNTTEEQPPSAPVVGSTTTSFSPIGAITPTPNSSTSINTDTSSSPGKSRATAPICTACAEPFTRTVNTEAAQWQCGGCKVKKQRSFHDSGVDSWSCSTCRTQWCAPCTEGRSSSNRASRSQTCTPNSQRTPTAAITTTTTTTTATAVALQAASPPTSQILPMSTAPSELPDDQEYLIETAVAHRLRGRPPNQKLEFRIKWAGFDMAACTWEPWDGLVDNDIVHAYMLFHNLEHLIDPQYLTADSPSACSPAGAPSTETSIRYPSTPPATSTVAPFLDNLAAAHSPQGEGGRG